MPEDLQNALIAFAKERKFNRKGPLCVALVMTQQARAKGLPLDSGELLTEGGGQVFGLGKSAVQSILQRHGITRVLASEGGRTSRGSIGNMREYEASTTSPSELRSVVITVLRRCAKVAAREMRVAGPNAMQKIWRRPITVV